MRKIIPLLLTFALLVSGTARAQTSTNPAGTAAINAAGAATLKKQVENELQWRIDMSKAFGQGLAMDGNVEVTPETGFYKVTLPHLSMTGGQKGKIVVGTVTAKATPAEKGAWHMEVTLPSTMEFFDENNQPAAHITIGDQRLTATCWLEQELCPALDSLLQKVDIKGVGADDPSATIEALKTSVALKDNGDGTWSGPIDFEMSGGALSVPGNRPVTLSAAKILSHNAYDRLDTRQTVKLKEETQKALQAGLPKTDAEKTAFLAKLLSRSPISMDGLSSAFEMDKFRLHSAAGTPQPQAQDITLGQLTFSSVTTGTQLDKSKVLLKTAFSGLNVSSPSVALAEFVPQTMNMEITFDNLPLKKMMDLLFDAVHKSVDAAVKTPGPDAQKQAQQTMAATASLLPKVLQEAGASATVQNTYTKSAALETNTAGRIDADATAVMGMTGKMSISLKGLDEALKKLRSAALQPGADPHTMGTLAGLMFVQMRGQPDKAADGKSIRNYLFEMTKDGRTLLNGQPLAPTPAPVQTSAPGAIGAQSASPAAPLPPAQKKP